MPTPYPGQAWGVMGGQTSRIPITFIDLQGRGMEGATTEATAGWDLKALSPTLASLSLLSYHSMTISNIFIITSFIILSLSSPPSLLPSPCHLLPWSNAEHYEPEGDPRQAGMLLDAQGSPHTAHPPVSPGGSKVIFLVAS